MDKYKQNLRIENNKVLSYNTHVADIDHSKRTVTKLGYWSSTTSKHTNYVASEFNYEVKEN